MPPKKISAAKVFCKPQQGTTIWAVRTNLDAAPSSHVAWTPYSERDCQSIENAYQALKTAVVSGGAYIVDTRQMRQVSATDAMKQREVKRFVADGTLLDYFNKRRRSLDAPSNIVDSDTQSDAEGDVVPPQPSQKKARTEEALGTTAPLQLQRVNSDGTITASDRSPLSRRASGASAGGSQVRSTSAPPRAVVASTSSSSAVACLTPKKTSPEEMKRLSGAFKVFLPDDKLAPEVSNAIADVLQRVEPISRLSLSHAADKMHPATRNWLRLLGRKDGESGTFITLATPLQELPGGKRIPLTGGHSTTAGELKHLASQAVVTYVGKKPKSILRRCDDESKMNTLTDDDYLQTQKLMISGPVKVLYDSNYDCVKAAVLPSIVVCSIPGINFSYSGTDSAAFTKLVEQDPDDDDEMVGAGRRRRRVLDKDKALRRMECIWDHVLRVMDEVHGVQYAVLCAIGCGAFKGPFGSLVPRLWAAALHRVLSAASKPFKALKAVFVSLPTFSEDNNFAPFAAVIDGAMKGHLGLGLRLPLVLVEDASMMGIACHLANNGARAGILNPSDVQAIRHGWIGMYWDGGHTALEEIMALQTTLLTHHIGLNRDLFVNSDRWVRSSSLDDTTAA